MATWQAAPGWRSGCWTTHLPSLTALTAQTGLATGTVRRAIDILAREHLLQTVSGRRTFVTR